MSDAQDYRAKEAEYTRLAREATFIADIKEYHRQAEHFCALAEREEFVAANRDRIMPSRAPADERLGSGFAGALTRYWVLMLSRAPSAAMKESAPYASAGSGSGGK
jgi:hypothetical protein